MADSILDDVKKIVGIAPSDTSFDVDIILHINTTISILKQIGVGPSGFSIMSDNDRWDDLIDEADDLEMVKSYVGLKVKHLFDPPATSFQGDALKNQIAELENRISIQREWLLDPVDPKVTRELNDAE